MKLNEKDVAAATLLSRLIVAIEDVGIRRVDPAQLLGLFIGAANGIAGLDGGGKVPAAQLPVGTDVQAYHAILASLAGQSLAADKLPYGSGANAFSLADLTAFGRTLIAVANAAAGRTALGTVIGTDVQAYHAILASLSGQSLAANKLPYGSGANVFSLTDLTAFGRTLIALADAAALRTAAGTVIGTDVQAYHAILASLSGQSLAANKLPYGSGANTFSLADLTAFGRTLIATADAAAARTALGLSLPQPTVYTAGSGTYNTPAGARWLRVRLQGGGGGGQGSGTSPGAGTNGGNTTFGGSLTAGGGTRGGASGTTGGAGGTATGGDVNIVGGAGSDGSLGYTYQQGGLGGGTPFGAAPYSTASHASINPPANTGLGGSGGSAHDVASPGGAGGGGGYVEKTITTPAGTYAYAVGAGGNAGAAGSGGAQNRAGATGASGIIIVEAFF